VTRLLFSPSSLRRRVRRLEHLSKISIESLLVQTSSFDSRYQHQYNFLRIKSEIEFALPAQQEHNMSKIVSVHSFRGGTGKSNTTANISALLAKQGFRVGVVDTDIQSPGIHVLFNLDESEMVHSLNDYLWGKCEIKETAHDVSGRIGADIKGQIFLIPSSIKPGEIVRVLREGYDVGLLNDGFRSLLTDLNLDYLIVDTHPGLNEETLLSIAISDALILIMRPDQQDYQGTAVTVDVARKLDVPNLFLVINKIPDVFDFESTRERAEELYDCPVAAILPHSDDMMALASSDIFSLRYPDHEITKELEGLVSLLKS
jgi:septum site-determining protein MinD